MSSSCSGLDARKLRETREFYNQLFGSTLGWYNAYVHPFIYQVLCIIGVFANICIIVILLRPQMRKNPFNIFLIAIAICDMTLMASYYLYKRVEMCHPWYFEYWWIIFTYAYAVMSVFVHSASLWMTVNMAVLRYLVLRSSASSNTSMPKMNTYSAASVSIAAAVVISLIGSAPNMLRYEIRDKGMSAVPYVCLTNESSYAHFYVPEQQVHAYTLGQPTFWSCTWERLSFWMAGLMLKLIPCLLLTVFMTLLVRMLVEARDRRLRLCQRGSNTTSVATNAHAGAAQGASAAASSYSCNGNSCSVASAAGASAAAATKPPPPPSAASSTSGSAAAERTTAMLTIIVAVFLITELPQGILVMTIGVQPQLGNLIDLLSLLNSSVNFILYSTMSNLFRNEFLHTFGQLCCCLNAKLCYCCVDDYGSAAGGSAHSGRVRRRGLNFKGSFISNLRSGGDSGAKSRLVNRAAAERSTTTGATTVGNGTGSATMRTSLTPRQSEYAVVIANVPAPTATIALSATPTTTLTVAGASNSAPTVNTTINNINKTAEVRAENGAINSHNSTALNNGSMSVMNGIKTTTVNSSKPTVNGTTITPLINVDNGLLATTVESSAINSNTVCDTVVDAKTPLIHVEFDETGDTILC